MPARTPAVLMVAGMPLALVAAALAAATQASSSDAGVIVHLAAEVAQVVIEISGRAWSTDPLSLPDATRHALETDGRTELLKVLDQDEPPHVIRGGSSGCSSLSADEAGERPSRT